MVSAVIPISPHTLVNRSRAISPAYPPRAYAAGTISGTAPYVTLRWPTAVSISTLARENVTVETCADRRGGQGAGQRLGDAPPRPG